MDAGEAANRENWQEVALARIERIGRFLMNAMFASGGDVHNEAANVELLRSENFRAIAYFMPRRSSGIVTLNTDPFPNVLVASRIPPNMTVSFREIDRPNPLP